MVSIPISRINAHGRDELRASLREGHYLRVSYDPALGYVVPSLQLNTEAAQDPFVVTFHSIPLVSFTREIIGFNYDSEGHHLAIEYAE